MEALATGAGFIVTLLVFSYLLGDNILFRLAMAVFVGLAAAYTAIVTVEGVIVPLLDTPGEIILFLVALVMTALLLARPFARLAGLTSLALVLLVAVGSAVAVVGALTGTLIPLVRDGGRGDNALELVILFVGTASALFYFQFSARRGADGVARRGPFNRTVAFVGEGFIAITLGAIYGAAILTSLTVLSERLSFLFGGG